MRRSIFLRKEALIALNVAEKNSVSKSVTEILSKKNFQLVNTLSKFNPVYKFNYQIKDQIYEMNFTSVRGHLFNFDFPASVRLWNVDTIAKLYEENPIPTIKPEDLPIKKNLQSLAKKADLLILWLDCDREGENIAFEVIEVVQKANSKIKILRAHFSALTEKDIIFSIENLQQPNKNLSDAVQLRSKMDLLLGASFTRLQTLYFRKIFEKYIDTTEIKKFSKPSYQNNYFQNRPDNGTEANQSSNLNKDFQNKNYPKAYNQQNFNYKMIVSYGPCQFPTLNFIVERNEEIKNFVSQNFYSLIFKLDKKLSESEIKFLEDSKNANKIKDGYIEVEFHWTKERLDEKADAERIRLNLQNSFSSKADALRVIEAKKKMKIKTRPLPLNTVEMQKLISRKLKIQSHKAMSIAEKLYNQGYISYPRTETQIYSKSQNLRKIVEDLSEKAPSDPECSWASYAKSLLESGKDLVARDGKSNDNSHPPISPVKFAKKSELSAEEYKIYNLLVVHYLASVSEDATGEETEVKLKIEDEVFNAKGFNLIKKGYLEVYPYDEWSDKFIPQFFKDEIIEYDERSKFEVTEGKTKPPGQMTEAELIELMDKNGIGTDATIHEHIKTIKERNYAVQTGSTLRPTIFGLALLKSYQALNIEIYKPNLRAAMEKDLSRICKGELSIEGLFEKMRFESQKFFEIVQTNIKLLENNLENYLANGVKNDYYVKLNEIADGNENENDNLQAKNESINQDGKIENETIDKANSNIPNNEKIDFSKELEENQKLNSQNEEIIKAIFNDNEKNKNKSNSNTNKLNIENSLRGMLNMDKRKKVSDQSETEDESTKNENSQKDENKNYNSFNNNNEIYKKDLLELQTKCPICKTANLKLLRNKKNLTYFIGCSGFPKCSFIKSINNPVKVRVSNELCTTCKENNRKTLLFELEFNNLKKRDKHNNIKEECFFCLFEKNTTNDNYSLKNQSEPQKNEYYKKPNYYNNNYNNNSYNNYRNNFHNKNKIQKQHPDEE